MSRDSLLIIGSGGLGREAARAARDGGFDGEVLGFLDDDPDRAGSMIAGLPVLGPIELLGQYPQALVVVATGRPDNYTSRPMIVGRIRIADDRFARIVHPSAALAADSHIGPGTIVLAGVVATAGVHIGAHVALMPKVVLTHDTMIADFATVASAVALAGGVNVGVGAYVGAGTLVRQDLRIGEWAMTGMASLVLSDVPDRRLWFGSPARDQGPSPAAAFGTVMPGDARAERQ